MYQSFQYILALDDMIKQLQTLPRYNSILFFNKNIYLLTKISILSNMRHMSNMTT